MKESLNILFVHNHYQIPGGEDTVFENEAKMLEKHGHHVFRYERSNTEINHMNLLQKARLFSEVKWSQKTYEKIRKLIRDHHIDLVHVHNPILLISPSVFDASLEEGVPVVQTLHNFRMICLNGVLYRDGQICEDCIERGIECAVRNHCYRGSRLQTLALAGSAEYNRSRGIYRNVHFICLTEFNKEKLLTLNKEETVIDPQKVFVKPNFIPETTPETAESSSDYYLYAGRLEEIKGSRILVEAFRQMPERRLMVIGDGELKHELQETASGNVVFMDRMPREELFGYMSKAKALVYPTQVYEGMPMMIGEAYMCGCPVITSNRGNASSMIIENKTGVTFDPTSVDSLIGAVERFEKLNTDWGKETKQYYYDYLTEEVNYRKLMDIYRTIFETM